MELFVSQQLLNIDIVLRAHLPNTYIPNKSPGHLGQTNGPSVVYGVERKMKGQKFFVWLFVLF